MYYTPYTVHCTLYTVLNCTVLYNIQYNVPASLQGANSCPGKCLCLPVYWPKLGQSSNLDSSQTWAISKLGQSSNLRSSQTWAGFKLGWFSSLDRHNIGNPSLTPVHLPNLPMF